MERFLALPDVGFWEIIKQVCMYLCMLYLAVFSRGVRMHKVSSFVYINATTEETCGFTVLQLHGIRKSLNICLFSVVISCFY